LSVPLLHVGSLQLPHETPAISHLIQLTSICLHVCVHSTPWNICTMLFTYTFTPSREVRLYTTHVTCDRPRGGSMCILTSCLHFVYCLWGSMHMSFCTLEHHLCLRLIYILVVSASACFGGKTRRHAYISWTLCRIHVSQTMRSAPWHTCDDA